MLYIMLESRVRCKLIVCFRLFIKQINCVSHRNYRGLTNLHPISLDSIVLRSIGSNQIFGTCSSLLCRQKFSSNYRFCKDFKIFYSSKPIDIADKKSSAKESDTANKPKKPKKEIKTYITLLGVDNSISVSTVDAAKKLADRRNLKLVKVVDFDPKSDRAVYKLMTESQYLKDDWDDSPTKKDKSMKDDKLVSLGSNTNENDVLTKVKMMKKWLTKNFEVRVVITGDTTSGENIYKIIARDLGNDGRIVQKRAKGSSIRFQIIPPKKSEEKVAEKTDKDK